ncbi:MAG: WbqC family protein [Bacteroidales bacterium]|nr:WbqC family protein [Bacteroidales bacterium]
MLVSTAYFPPILYYAWLFHNNNVQVEQYETFPKQTYRNRCVILTANGLQSLSVPVIKPFGKKTLTRDIKIAYDEAWQQLHWRSIKTAYNSSPFLLYYHDDLEAFFKQKHRFLIDLNEAVIALINDLMEWEIKLKRTETFVFPKELPVQGDKRFSLSPKDNQEFGFERYIQVFSDQYPFFENLSILDLIFNLGPEAESYLMRYKR